MKKFLCLGQSEHEPLMRRHSTLELNNIPGNFHFLSRDQKIDEIKESKYPLDGIHLFVPSLHRTTTRNKELKKAIFFHQNKILNIILELRTDLDELNNEPSWSSYQFNVGMKLNKAKSKIRNIDYSNELSKLSFRHVSTYRDIISGDQITLTNHLDSLAVSRHNAHRGLSQSTATITSALVPNSASSPLVRHKSFQQWVDKAVEDVAVSNKDVDSITAEFKDSINTSLKLRIDELRVQFERLTKTLDRFSTLDECEDDEIYNYLQTTEKAAKQVADAQRFKLESLYNCYKTDNLFKVLLLSNLFDFLDN